MAQEQEGPVPVDEMLSRKEQAHLKFVRWLIDRKKIDAPNDHKKPKSTTLTQVGRR